MCTSEIAASSRPACLAMLKASWNRDLRYTASNFDCIDISVAFQSYMTKGGSQSVCSVSGKALTRPLAVKTWKLSLSELKTCSTFSFITVECAISLFLRSNTLSFVCSSWLWPPITTARRIVAECELAEGKNDGDRTINDCLWVFIKNFGPFTLMVFSTVVTWPL